MRVDGLLDGLLRGESTGILPTIRTTGLRSMLRSGLVSACVVRFRSTRAGSMKMYPSNVPAVPRVIGKPRYHTAPLLLPLPENIYPRTSVKFDHHTPRASVSSSMSGSPFSRTCVSVSRSRPPLLRILSLVSRCAILDTGTYWIS